MASAQSQILVVQKPICIAQGAIEDYTVIVEKALFLDNGTITSRSAQDLTGSVLTWLLRDKGTDQVIRTLKGDGIGQNELEFVGPFTDGRATLHLTDTESSFDRGDQYEHIIWIDLPSGERSPIWRISPYEIVDGIREDFT